MNPRGRQLVFIALAKMTDLALSIGKGYAALALRGFVLPVELMTRIRKQGVKTYDYFGQVIDRLVRSLYNHQIDELEFTMTFEDLLDGQLRQAWFEGMAQNGLTEDDMTQEYETELGSILSSEHDAISGFTEAILTQEGQDHLSGENHLDALLSRANLWQNRYQDVVNRATLFTAADKDKQEWVEGDTEKKCPICVALDGIVAPARVWMDLGVRPQNPPNDALSPDRDGCGGWRCGCQLVPSDKRATPNAADVIASIVGR